MPTKKSASKPSTPTVTVEGAVGTGGELHQRANKGQPVLTTNQGLPVSDNQNSLRTHARGPTLLEDFILREKITHFDHERIPERIVHARGTGLHGTFTLTHSLAKYTRARILNEVGVETPVFARFSTVAGGSGSIDTPRDVRGFAVKFYTQEGNWDLVGNNIPVFFIQDAIKFPDVVHAVKMEPDRGFPQAASAHDTFWDFISLTPESMHMIMWTMSDRTIPRSLAMMEGFGVHTFRLVNDAGESTFVKFHWRPELGAQATCWDEAVKIAGADPDFHRRELFNSIEQGKFPAWGLFVQLFSQAEADALEFDALDPTKLIPEEIIPLTPVGRMELDRYPDNFFAETEQVAFCPSHVVPGIDFSDDPLLQGRLFSYLDTQLSRLGTPNFHQLPINAPKCPFQNLQRDGKMQMSVPKGRVAYEPNSLSPGGSAPPAPRETADGFRSFAADVGVGQKARIRAETFADHYSQARLFYLSQTQTEQAHIAYALVFELSKVETPHVREAVVGHLIHIDDDLAQRVAAGLGLDELPMAPDAAADVVPLDPSPALSLLKKAIPTLKGRTVGILVADGSDRVLVEALQKEVEAQGAGTKLIAPRIGAVKWADGKTSPADAKLDGAPSVFFDAVAIVLSKDGANKLANEAAAVDFVRDAFSHLKAIAHNAEAQVLLDVANVKVDAGVVDAANVANFVSAAKTRQWAREPSVRTLP